MSESVVRIKRNKYDAFGPLITSLQPNCRRGLPPDQIVEAHKYVEESQKLGNVVVRVN